MEIFIPRLVDDVGSDAGFFRLHPDRRRDFFVTPQLEKIGNGAAFRSPAHLRNFINLLHVSAPGGGEEHEVIVRRGGEEMFDEIAFVLFARAFPRRHSDHAFAAAALSAESADGGAFDESAVGDADDAAFVRDQILHVDLALVGNELRQTRTGVFLLNLAQLFLDDLEDARFLRQNVEQILNGADQLLVFVRDLVALQPGELIKAEIEDLVRLMFAESVTAFDEARFVADANPDLLDLFPAEFKREQFHACFFAVGRAANDADELIQIRERDEITFERFGAVFGFAQLVARPAQDDLAAMFDVSRVRFLERKQFRPAVVDREHRSREGTLHLSVLVEIVDDDLGIAVALQFNDDARVLIRLVANRADIPDHLLVHELRDPFDEGGAVHVVGNFRDHDLLAVPF